MDKKLKFFIIFFFIRLFIQPWEQLFSEIPENEVSNWVRNAKLVGVTHNSSMLALETINWDADSGLRIIHIKDRICQKAIQYRNQAGSDFSAEVNKPASGIRSEIWSMNTCSPNLLSTKPDALFVFVSIKT